MTAIRKYLFFYVNYRDQRIVVALLEGRLRCINQFMTAQPPVN